MPSGLAQLKSACAMARTRRCVVLPDGSEFIWYQSPLTLSERERAEKRAGKDSENVLHVALCILIMKAFDQDGQKLFQQGEIMDLKQDIPETVLGDFMREIFRDSLTEDDEEDSIGVDVTPKQSSKNSKGMAA